jgi:phenylalanyl-tRNA synthetase beta chain
MKVPLSWLKDYVDVDMPVEELARMLTMAGVEVEEIRYVGLPMPETPGETQGDARATRQTNITGLAWDRDKIVVGAVLEVMPHPNADRLVLCRLDDGEREHIVLTGAPNLIPYKGKGPLEKPLKVAYAREGARIYDGHQTGWKLMTLQRAKIRGVESYSMACSEKELGISEDHEGIIILDEDAPVGMPLADYMGDVVLDITLTPNMAHNANVYGVAREVAALTGAPLGELDLEVPWSGPPIQGRVSLEIREPELNPRFVLGLIEGLKVGPSPYWVQRRLKLAGMRPVNNVVDATNYAMLAIGEPLHAFDYDALVRRAGGGAPKIITRRAERGEKLVTLDEVERELDDFTVLVADTAGPLSIAGVMGGAETEVGPQTRNVLLEGAAWNLINIRRTLSAQRLTSEAAYRFSRGVHPAMAERGVRLGLKLIQAWAGGSVAQGLVDEYPLPPQDPVVEITPQDAQRWLGIRLEAQEMEGILRRLGFALQREGERIRAKRPDHRLDISPGIVGVADLMEEVARIYGYDRIPTTQISDTIPPQYGNPELEREEKIRDVLVALGLQEVITYRLTSPEREARLRVGEGRDFPAQYVELANPISRERRVMRRSLLASVLEVVERNARIRPRLTLFEIGPVFLPRQGEDLPQEKPNLALALSGLRREPFWGGEDQGTLDFYDLKGVLEGLLEGLKVEGWRFRPTEHPSFHPGKCAALMVGQEEIGTLGEIHPLVAERFDFPDSPVLAAELDLERLMAWMPEAQKVEAVSPYPPVLEDLAFVVDEEVPAQAVEEAIRQAGGDLLREVRLFDLYRGEQVGEGKKSLAYSLVYQASDRTLTDQEVAKIRARIIRRVEKALGGALRG